MLLSICIPNYNRPTAFKNCLDSIYRSKLKSSMKFEVCISDNDSEYNVYEFLREYKGKLRIKLNINKKNIGVGANILKVVSMAKGEFVWVIGNDDLILPDAILNLSKLLKRFKDIDFFFVNCLEGEFKDFLDKKNLQKFLKRRSLLKKSKKLKFFELIDRRVSWDFLMGLYLSVFKRKKWNKNIKCIKKNLLLKKGVFSTFENTCPHVKIFANSFNNSNAYFEKKPFCLTTSNEKEWNNMYNFIEIVRMPEILDFYRLSGLPLKKYLINKNFSLRNFCSYFLKIFFYKDSGIKYVNFKNHFLKNFIYPNVYFSIFRLFFKGIKKIIYHHENS